MDRVQQDLSVLAAWITLTDQGIPREYVVAVVAADPGKRSVVQTDHAHDAVRNSPHRCQGAHGQVAGTKAGAGGSAGEQLVQQGAYVSEPDAGACTRTGRLGNEGGQRPSRAQHLPVVSRGDVREQVEGVEKRRHPGLQGLVPSQGGRDCVQPVDVLGESAHEVDVLGADVVQGQHTTSRRQRVLAHGDTEQQSVEPRSPGVLDDAIEAGALPMRVVESPADPRRDEPGT